MKQWMSTVLWWVMACSVHLGVAPVSGQWAVQSVSTPVVEPEIDAWFRESLTTALTMRGAWSASGDPIRATITEATWAPSRRSGAVLLYEGRLTVRIEAGQRSWTRTRSWTTVDSGDAAGSRRSREDTFRALSRLMADDVVAALAAG
jgi:hypothetical protein